MSTLKADTISNVSGTYSATTETIVRGSCKAWVQTGDGSVITGSLNISSVSEPNANYKQINFTTAFSDASFAVVCNAGPGPDNSGPRYATIRAVGTTYAQASYSDDSSDNMVAITYWAVFR